MLIDKMEGSQRQLFIDAIDTLLKNSNAAKGTLSGSFLPTTVAEEQVAKLEKAKSAVPIYDDVERDVEIIEPLVGVCRNAIVVHARLIDKTVRASERARKVSTRESDATIAELQKILKVLGDERILEDEVKVRPKSKDETEPDPAQIDFTSETEAAAATAGQG